MDKITFVKVSISDRLLITYEDEVHVSEDWPFFLEGLLHEGFKVSLVSKADSGSVGVTITDKRKGSPNSNCCFSQWAGDLGRATQKAAIVLLMADGRKWGEVVREVKETEEAILERIGELLRKEKQPLHKQP